MILLFVILENGRRRLELPNAKVVLEHGDNNRTRTRTRTRDIASQPYL